MQIISSVPGRLRIKSERLYRNQELTKIIELFLIQENQISKQKVNSVTGSILIYYDQNKLTQSALTDKINEVLAGKTNDLHHLLNYAGVYFQEKADFNLNIKKTLLFGGIYLGIKLKNYLISRSAAGSNLPVLMIAAVITIISDYPTLKNCYQKSINCFSANTDSDRVLTILGMLFTFWRESSEGMALLLLQSLTDTLKSQQSLKTKELLIKNKVAINDPRWQKKEFNFLEEIAAEIKIDQAKIIAYQDKTFRRAITLGGVSLIFTGSMINPVSILLVMSPAASNLALTKNDFKFCKTYNHIFCLLAFFGILDPFQAKSINTFNSLILIGKNYFNSRHRTIDINSE